MHTVENILNRSVSNWSKILGCGGDKTATRPQNQEIKVKKSIGKKTNKKEKSNE